MKITNETGKKIDDKKISCYAVMPKSNIVYQNNSDEIYMFIAMPFTDAEEIVLK